MERHCFADEKSAALKKSRNTTDGLLIRVVSIYSLQRKNTRKVIARQNMAEEGEKTPSWSIKHHISSIKNVVQTFNASECSLPLFWRKKCSCSAISYIAFIAATNTIRAVVSKEDLYHKIPRTIAEKANFWGFFRLSWSLFSWFSAWLGFDDPQERR